MRGNPLPLEDATGAAEFESAPVLLKILAKTNVILISDRVGSRLRTSQNDGAILTQFSAPFRSARLEWVYYHCARRLVGSLDAQGFADFVGWCA